MVYYFTPYALDKNLGKAYNAYMELLPNDDDWACFTDGDTMFQGHKFGHIIHAAIVKYPGTGMFTCFTNRVNNIFQLWGKSFSEKSCLKHHGKIAAACERLYFNSEVMELTREISGMMMIIQKKTWRKFPFKDGLLGVDNDISKRLLQAHMKILLIKGIYITHSYRINEGRKYTKHLL